MTDPRPVGSSRSPRDEFLERQFPGDPYQLGPAAFSDADEALHEPGLVWGAGAWPCISVVIGVRSWLTMSSSPEI